MELKTIRRVIAKVLSHDISKDLMCCETLVEKESITIDMSEAPAAVYLIGTYYEFWGQFDGVVSKACFTKHRPKLNPKVAAKVELFCRRAF